MGLWGLLCLKRIRRVAESVLGTKNHSVLIQLVSLHHVITFLETNSNKEVTGILLTCFGFNFVLAVVDVI